MRVNETEPVSFTGAIGLVLSTGLTLAAVLWPQRLTPEVQAAILGFGNALIWLGAIYFGRKGSTPIAAPVLTAGTPVTTPTGDKALVTPQ